MAVFNQHNRCARCRRKGQDNDPCVKNLDCNFCNVLTSDQRAQLSTPTYKARKEKKAYKLAASPSEGDTSSVRVLGQVNKSGNVVEKEVQLPPEKKNSTSSKNKKKSTSSKQSNIFNED